MKRFAIAYGCAALILCSADFVWLVSMTGYYQSQLGALLKPNPDLAVAVLFYLVYLVGVVRFAVLPGIARRSPGYAATAGALLGIVSYGTYDFTNLATLSGWTPAITIVDLAWGCVLTTVTAGLGCRLAQRWIPAGAEATP